ncbi:MAG TPA: glutamate--tRNA ligase [Acidimicrobiia bacterium]|nr:glutamate--tRNA ligase [Acidimicrobiia bacterium]
MTAPVRVRFSPAPTGMLHVGSVRTALFNWLFARHHHGELVLRIEDTDTSRSRPEWITGIQDTLRWLGLDWDGNVVLQSQRFAEYRAAAEQLVEERAVYECFCTPEEIAARNDAAKAEGRGPGYDGHCRDLTAEDRATRAAERRPRTLRFRTPDDGASSFVDLIRGEVRVEWSTISDFVIVRSDGTPLFFLANAIDDLEMGITHVIRGDDLLDSTHRVLALRAALSPEAPPAYAHLPLILGPDRAKLSKRHGAVALEELREAGYLPEAIRNYLALLGWSPEDGREVLRIQELIELFDLDAVTHANAAFDHAKLDWMNGEWIRRLTRTELEAATMPLAERRYGPRLDLGLLRGALEIGQERSTTLGALLDQADFLFAADDDFVIAPESWAKVTRTERVAEIFDAVIAHLRTCDWTPDAIDPRSLLTDLGFEKPGKVLPSVYAAVEGRHAGLPLFESIHLLGRDRAVHRLEAARARLEA